MLHEETPFVDLHLDAWWRDSSHHTITRLPHDSTVVLQSLFCYVESLLT